MGKNKAKTEKKKFITGYLVSKDRQMPIKLEVRQSEKKEKKIRPSKAQKKRIKEIVGSGPNIKAILIGTEKYLLESGEYPGEAEIIKIRRRHAPQKRVYKKEASFISR